MLRLSATSPGFSGVQVPRFLLVIWGAFFHVSAIGQPSRGPLTSNRTQARHALRQSIRPHVLEQTTRGSSIFTVLPSSMMVNGRKRSMHLQTASSFP